MVCCFLKTTFNSERDSLTSTYKSWYYFKLSGIYRINKNAWLRVLLKRILHLSLAPDRAFSAIFAQCLHMILCDIFCIGPYGVTFGNFNLMDPWMCLLCCLWWRQNRMSSDNFRVLGNAARLCIRSATRLGKLELSHQHENFSVCYDVPGYIFLLLICHCWALKIQFLILWNFLASRQTFIYLNMQLCISSNSYQIFVLFVNDTLWYTHI